MILWCFCHLSVSIESSPFGSAGSYSFLIKCTLLPDPLCFTTFSTWFESVRQTNFIGPYLVLKKCHYLIYAPCWSQFCHGPLTSCRAAILETFIGLWPQDIEAHFAVLTSFFGDGVNCFLWVNFVLCWLQWRWSRNHPWNFGTCVYIHTLLYLRGP